MKAADVVVELKGLADGEKARLLQGFFKTGPGEYGAGDVFLGIMVPVVRGVVKRHRGLPLGEVGKLVRSGFHEVRLFALLSLVDRYVRGVPAERARIYEFYLGHTRWVNNWDLVDLSAPNIVGAQLAGGGVGRGVLRRLARSAVLWERRIAIVATLHFIRSGDFGDTLRISELLLGDREDLIHKAVGWMLREVGKRDEAVLKAFLGAHYARMPRTALRYAIERFSAEERREWLGRKGKLKVES